MTATPVSADAASSVRASFFRLPASVPESRLVAVMAAAVVAVIGSVGRDVWSHPWGIATLLAPIVLYFAWRPKVGLALFLLGPLAGSLYLFDAAHLLVAAFPLAALELFTWMEGRRGLRLAARLQVLRDSLWLLIGLMMCALVAFAAADRVERIVFERAFRTPLEGLAMSAGILAGALLFLALAAVVWLLPSIAARRMSAGLSLPSAAADALWFGALLGALALAFDVRAIAGGSVFSGSGQNCAMALAATFAYATVRLRLRFAAAPEVEPLWILFLGTGKPSRAARRHAAVLAARWANGPVTVVAPPEAALSWAGTHVRLTGLRGRVEAMFPQRPVHLADWSGTLPPREAWQTLPIRELYLDSALWPELFAGLESSALVVAMDDSHPKEKVVKDLRALLPTGRTDFHVPDNVNPGVIDTHWPAVEVYPIVGGPDVHIDEWIERNAKQQESVPGPRLVVIEHTKRDSALANRLTVALRGEADARGRKVFPIRVVDGGWGMRLWNRTVSNVWRLAVDGRRWRGVTRGHWYEWVGSALARLAAFGIMGAEYDLLVIDDPARTTSPGTAVGLSRRAQSFADRQVAVLSPGSITLNEPFGGVWTGVIYRSGEDLDVQVAHIVDRYLALDFDIVPPAPLREPPVDSKSSAWRPRLYFSFSEDVQGIAELLGRNLLGTCDVYSRVAGFLGRMPRASLIPEPLPANVQQRIEEADAVIAIMGRKAADSVWVRSEIDLAASLQKPIIPVFIDPIDPQSDPTLASVLPATYKDVTALTLRTMNQREREAALRATAKDILRAVRQRP